MLKQVAENFNFETEGKDEAQKLFEQLRDAMCELKVTGITAPQLGIMKRVFVMGNPQEKDNIIPVFNPRIVNLSDEVVKYEEGCPSFPGIYLKIKRPQTIRVRYAGIDGTIDTINFDGYTSRIFQHEYDHLEGICFTERTNKFNLDRAKYHKKLLDRARKRYLKQNSKN